MTKMNRPPKYSKNGKYAVVYVDGKKSYLGLYGSQESKTAYARFLSDWQSKPVFTPCTGEPTSGVTALRMTSVTVAELIAAFLDHAKASFRKPNYTHYRIALMDFLSPFYGDSTPVARFTPRCLKQVRDEMVRSRRLCRMMVNDYVRRIVTMFSWGVSEEYVPPEVAMALRTVKPLTEGHPGTFDHAERADVPDEIIRRTLPFMPPTLAAMVQVQRMTGCRPSEIFNMKVGEIDMKSDPDLWLYCPAHHKTESKTKRKKVIPLGKPEQALIAPYLPNKRPENAVFSPRTAMQERNDVRRNNRKSKRSPSQRTRDAVRAKEPSPYSEFYNKDSYLRAIRYAIEKANKVLPECERIPSWTPYQVRHTAATVLEQESDIEDAQILLDHESINTTKRYTKRRLEKSKQLARTRKNPFLSE